MKRTVGVSVSSQPKGTFCGKPMDTLRVALADWTDFDVSAHVLAQCLGIMPSGLGMNEAKWVYWSDNPLGNMLYGTLERLLKLRRPRKA